VVGYGPGDVARGVREEPVEERDAYVVGQRQARSAWEPRSRALVAQPTYVAVLVLGPDLQDCQHLVREKVQKGRNANSAENSVVILRSADSENSTSSAVQPCRATYSA
jgi:hypothetical protein